MFRGHRWVWIGLCLVVVILFTIRLTVFSRYATPPSSDVGNHLTILHAFLGNDVSGLDLAHRTPPLYFLLILAPLLKLFPLFIAIKVSMALISAIMAIPFFFIMRRIIKDDAISLLAAGLFAFGSGFSEMVCWGAIPNLFAIFLMLWSAYFLLCALERNSKRDAIFSGVFLSLTVGSHLITAPYYILSLILLGLGLLALKKKEAFPQVKILLLMGTVGALLSLPYLWTTYLAPLREGYLFPKFGVGDVFTGIDIAAGLRHILGYLVLLWSVLVILGLIWIWRRFEDKLVPIFIISLGTSSLILSYLYAEKGGRLLNFLQIPIFLILGIIFLQLKKGIIWAKSQRRLVYAALFFIPLIAIPVVAVRDSYNRFTESVEWYHVLGDDVVEALDWLKEHTELDDVIISSDGYLSWWIEGYAERKSYRSSSLEYEQYASGEEHWQMDIGAKTMAGNHIVDNADLRVADFFPSSPCNPRIILYQKDRYEELLYFDDNYVIFGIGNGQVVALSSAPKKEMERYVGTERIKLTYHYIWDFADFTRVEVTTAPEVNITYGVSDNAGIDYLVAVARMAPGMKIEEYNVAGDRITILLRDRYEKIINITLEVTSGWPFHVEFVPGGSSVNFMPSFYFYVSQLPFTLSVKVGEGFTRGEVEYHDGIELLQTYADYILVSSVEAAEARGLYRDVCRFDLDPRFEKVFENNGALIFRVLK